MSILSSTREEEENKSDKDEAGDDRSEYKRARSPAAQEVVNIAW